jgi:hypothetical protein
MIQRSATQELDMKNWIAVASATHARRGREHRPNAYMQVCRSELAPIRRDVRYLPARAASILPLIDRFEFVAPRQRFGVYVSPQLL